MKILYIFMVSVIGVWSPKIILAGGDESEHPAQARSLHSKSILTVFKRSSSHSSTTSTNSDRQSDVIVGSLESTASSHSSSSSSISSPRQEESGNLLSRSMRRFSRRFTRAPVTRNQEEWVVEDPKQNRTEILSQELAEARRNLDEELDKVQIIVIPGVIRAARNIFEETEYTSQALAEDNNDAVADVRNTLTHLQKVLQAYITRSSAEVVQEYERTIDLNFAIAGDFYPRGIYLYLGFTIAQGKSKTCDELKAIIARKKERATLESTLWVLRQIEHTIDNSEVKKLYDAYLEGEEALKAMQIEPREREHYWYLAQTVLSSNAAIEEAAHEYTKKLKAYRSHTIDLADHALSLE